MVRTRVLDVCTELDTAQQFSDYLVVALSDACDAQQIRLQMLIDDNMPRTSANDVQKAALFETWWMSVDNNFASAALFQDAMTDMFNDLYDNQQIDPIDSMITVESVPDKCNIFQQMTETTLMVLV